MSDEPDDAVAAAPDGAEPVSAESSRAEPVSAAPVRAGADKPVRLIGIVVVVLGAIFTIAGVTTYVLVGNTLADEQITVADDASHFAGDPVDGPFTAYVQADTIAKHAEGIADGKTYAQLDQDDPRRESVMDASFLRASLFTSVLAFGVAALVAVLGLILIALGWALMRLGRPSPTT